MRVTGYAAAIEALLAAHDACAEGAGNVCARCEAALGDEAIALSEAARPVPAVPTARQFDGYGVHRTAPVPELARLMLRQRA